MALARWQGTITDGSGNLVTGAQVEVRQDIPGAPKVSIFSDRDGTLPMDNPFTSVDGLPAFHPPGGVYRIRAYKDAFEQTWRYVGIGTASEVNVEDLGIGANVDVQVDASADRDAYDEEDEGFRVLVSNAGDGRAAIYSRAGETGWSDPAYVTGVPGGNGAGLSFDVQVADMAARAAYDDEAEGFRALVSDTGDGRAAIYSKNSATSEDWSAPAYITGPQGENIDTSGWSPLFALVSDGARRVLQIYGYVGGDGEEPDDYLGAYIGAAGPTFVIEDGIDLRGATGLPGAGTGDMLAETYDPQDIAGDAFDRGNHTGTQTLDTISDVGDAAGKNVGTAAGDVAAGDDDRIVNATPMSRTIVAGTGMTGGGDLSANRTLAVDKASAANVRAGTADKVLTPDNVVDAMAWVAITAGASPTIDHAAGVNRTITHLANATFGAPSNSKPGWPLNIDITPGIYTTAWNAVYKFGSAGAPTITSRKIAHFMCRDASTFVFLGVSDPT